MTYSYGAQPSSTNTGYQYQGGNNAAPAPPPIPTGNPYNNAGQYQQNITSPMFYFGQLGYAQEPTLVDVIADIVQDNEDMGDFLANGGFQALSDVVKETIDNRLKNFFSGLVLIQEKSEDGNVFRISTELSGDETKAVLSKSDSDLTTAITEISGSVRTVLVDPNHSRIKLHREAAKTQRDSGLMGQLMADAVGNEQQGGGVTGFLGNMLGNTVRVGLGQPPNLQQPPGR